MVRLRFSTMSAWDSAVIRWRTDFYISHVEFEFDGGWTFGARFRGGVKRRGPEECKGQRNVHYASFLGIEDAFRWAIGQRDGFPYNTKAIFGMALARRDMTNPRARFCSELVIEAARQVGVQLLDPAIPQWQVTPRDLLLSPVMIGL